MAQTPVAAQVHQSLDADGQLAAQVAFDREAADLVADALEVDVGKVLDLLRVRDPDRGADLLRRGAADAVNGGQTDFRVLVRRDVDAGDACHVNSFFDSQPLRLQAQRRSAGVLGSAGTRSRPASPLTLLVARVGADDAHHALAADDLAVTAHLLDGSGDFHGLLLDPSSSLDFARKPIRARLNS